MHTPWVAREMNLAIEFVDQLIRQIRIQMASRRIVVSHIELRAFNQHHRSIADHMLRLIHGMLWLQGRFPIKLSRVDKGSPTSII